MKFITNKKFYVGTLLLIFILTLSLGLFGMVNARKAYADASNIQAVSVTLDEDIKVNVKITAPEGYTTASINFAIGSGEETVVEDLADGSAVLTSGLVTPRYMNEVLTMTLTLSGEGKEDIVEEKNDFTLKSYLTNLLSSSAKSLGQTETKNALMQTLVVDLLNYGAEAQNYVASKSGAEAGVLANADLTSEQLALATDYNDVAPEKSDLNIVGGDASAIEYKKAGLIFDHNVALYVKFARASVDNLTVKVDNDGVVTEINEFIMVGSDYAFVYDAISATQFNNVLKIQAYEGETAIGGLLTYSVASYVHNMQDDAEIGALAKATYAYGHSASAYKNADIIYPTQGTSEENVLYKGNTAYSFMAVSSDGNASASAEKGWFLPSKGSNNGLPTVVDDGAAQYLKFDKTAQIELFFNKGSLGNTYHIFDNDGNWSSEEAQELFYKEYTYEFQISANGPFMLGLCDFRQNNGVFASDSSDGSLSGITFLFDGDTVKMSRCSSAKVEATASLSGVNFADGTVRKISFAIVRKALNDGQIRVFVDEQKVMFEATEDYGSTTVSTNKNPGGTVVNGTLNFPDANKYGQRFTVAPQALNEGYSTVNIYGYSKKFVNTNPLRQYTVTLEGGLKFADGTTTKSVDEYYDVFANVDLTGYNAIFNVTTGTEFFGLICGDVTLAPVLKDPNDIMLTLQQFSNVNATGLANSITKKDAVFGGKLGRRFTYTDEFTKDYKIRFCNTLASGNKFTGGVTYVSTFTIKNYSSARLTFKLYEITSGHTLTDFNTSVDLASGECATYTIEWSFASSNNMLPFIVFDADHKGDDAGFDFAIAYNVVQKAA